MRLIRGTVTRIFDEAGFRLRWLGRVVASVPPMYAMGIAFFLITYGMQVTRTPLNMRRVTRVLMVFTIMARLFRSRSK